MLNTPAPQTLGLQQPPQAMVAPGLEPLRQATSSPFDSLVGVMSGGGLAGGTGVGGMPGVAPHYYSPAGQSASAPH